jgi:hypothetical protein
VLEGKNLKENDGKIESGDLEMGEDAMQASYL